MISNPCVPSGGQWDTSQQAGPPLLFPFPPFPSDYHHHHLPSPQPTPPTIYPSLRRFGYTMLVTGLCSPPLLSVPVELDWIQGERRFPQDPSLESDVLGRTCRGSRAEKICGQNQCIATLMGRSNRFGNFTFPTFSLGTLRRPHDWRQNNIHQTLWERGFLGQNMAQSIPNRWLVRSMFQICCGFLLASKSNTFTK